MKILKHIGIYIRLSRIKNIIIDYFWILSIIAILATSLQISPFNAILGSFVALLVQAYAYIVNDLEDAEDDAMDPIKAKRNIISSGEISYSTGLNYLRVTALITIVPVLVFQSLLSSLIIAFGLLLGHLYSIKSIRLKRYPILDFTSHGYALAAFHVLYFISMPEVNADIYGYLIVLGAWLFSAGGCMYNQIRDYEVDLKSNLKNTTLTFGYNTGKSLMIIFYTIGTFTTLFSLLHLYIL